MKKDAVLNSRIFSLRPFHQAEMLPRLKITGAVGRCSDSLSISYELLGPLTEVAISPPADMPARRNGLWEETCFEFFLGLENSDRYWEFNLSPAGHWNVYRFQAYRQNMHEEQYFDSLPIIVKSRKDALNLSAKIDLGKIALADQALEVGISAVIKAVNGTMTFWALTHHGPRADFHRREGFIVVL